MDLIKGLSCIRCQHNSIWVIIDCITNLAHISSVITTDTPKYYSIMYIKEIVKLH